MSTKPKKPGRLEREMEALRPALAQPSAPAARELLQGALRRSCSFVVARAAEVIREHSLAGLEADLQRAFERFLDSPVKSDPGCKAKQAILEALDFLESADEKPFLAALRHFQKEPAWGAPVDTACGLRARGALGLARLGHGELLLLMADLLADPEAPVRQAAAEAIAHRGDPAGAALLQLKLHAGDAEGLVTLACASGLLALAPEWGVAKLDALLQGEAEDLREIAALALGQSRREDALERLLSALSAEVLSRRRAVLLRALALNRSDRALESLLRVIASGDGSDAKRAIESLAFRSFEPGLEQRVREAAARNAERDLSGAIESAFNARH